MDNLAKILCCSLPVRTGTYIPISAEGTEDQRIQNLKQRWRIEIALLATTAHQGAL